jgi:hypothetical protein
LISGFSFLQLKAQDQDMSVVEDLSLRVYRLNKNEVTFSANFNQENVLGFYVTRQDEFDLLKICSTDSFTLWRQGQMLSDLSLCYEISFSEYNALSSSDTVYFAMLSEGYFQGLDIKLYAESTSSVEILNPVGPRVLEQERDWSIIMLFLLGVFAAIIRYQNPALFAFLFSLQGKKRRGTEIDVELNLDLFIAILFVSSINIFNLKLLGQVSSVSDLLTTSDLLISSLSFTFLLCFALVSKYFVISLLAEINTLSRLKGIQFVDFLKFFSIGGLLVGVVLQALFWGGYLTDFQTFWVFRNIYLIIYAVFILYFYVRLARETSYKKLHIISYLCTTEFVGVFLLALIIYK